MKEDMGSRRVLRLFDFDPFRLVPIVLTLDKTMSHGNTSLTRKRRTPPNNDGIRIP